MGFLNIVQNQLWKFKFSKTNKNRVVNATSEKQKKMNN